MNLTNKNTLSYITIHYRLFTKTLIELLGANGLAHIVRGAVRIETQRRLRRHTDPLTSVQGLDLKLSLLSLLSECVW